MNTETKLTLTGALAILASDAVTTWLLAMGKFPSALCISLFAFLISALRNKRKTF